MSVEETDKLLKSEKVYVFDCKLDLYYMVGHIPEAKLLWYEDVKPEVLPADKAAKLLFYCKNEQCLSGPTAAKKAVALGYMNVYVMPEGIEGWVKAGKPTVKGEAAPAKSTM